MKEYEKIITAVSKRNIQTAIDGFSVDLNDELTNNVRSYLDSLSIDELKEIQQFFNDLLNLLYDEKLYESKVKEADKLLIRNLNEKDKFKLKETVIYFSGRIPLKVDLDILKKVYYLDDNKYIKMNLTYSTLSTFDEELELDFVEKLTTIDEYDEMIRSWTMAFFKNINNPYEYKDRVEDDWTKAKTPRINRLAINEKENPKYKKAMAYRLLDFVVIYLFLRNRKNNSLSEKEKEIINNSFIDYELYSENKKNTIRDFRKKIITIGK